MKLIVCDIETYYDKEYTLSKMTTEEYIRDPRFEVIGLSIKVDDGETMWGSGTHEQIKRWLHTFDWPDAMLLAHNTMFDAAILSWVFDVHPKALADTLCMGRALDGVDVGGSLAAMAKRYGLGEKGTEVVNALGKRRADFTEEELSRYGDYCINDVELTYKLFRRLAPVFPKTELKLIDMTLRMFTEPQLELDRQGLETHLKNVRQHKNELLIAAGVADKKDLMSNAKFAELLQDLGVEPPTKISPTTGKETFAFAKTDDGFKALLEHEDDRVQALAAARLGNKSTLEESRTERFIGIAERGKFPVPIKYYAAHCLTGDAEVLTRVGWRSLDSWGGGDIAQWNDAGDIQFLPAEPNAFMVSESVVEYSSRYHKATYTLGHTIPAVSGRGVFRPDKAGNLASKRFELPISGKLVSTSLVDEAAVRLAVMVQADGNVRMDNGREVRFGFTKERKIKRCRELLAANNIEFTEYAEASGATRIRIPARHFDKVTQYIDPATKTFSASMYTLPTGAREAFLEELSLWDGHREPGSGFTYTTTNKHNVDVVQAIAHTTGRATYVREIDRSDRGWSLAYAVYVRVATQTRVMPEHHTARHHDGLVYCPTTETGYFLVRQRGTVFVTGNTGRWGGADKVNVQNLPSRGPNAKAIKNCIMAPEGYVLVDCDSSQIEARVLAWLAGQWDLVEAFANKEDVYVKMASRIYGKPEDQIDKHERFVGKSVILGSGFGMGAVKFQAQLRGFGTDIDLDEARRIISIYRETNPFIVKLWRDCQDMLKHLANGQALQIGREGVLEVDAVRGGIKLPSGLLIYYPKLHAEQGEKGPEYVFETRKGPSRIYGGKVVENVVQGIARCVVGEQMLRISKRYFVALTVHDAAVAVVPEAEQEEGRAWIEEQMRWVPTWADGLPVDCESHVGRRYGVGD